MLLLSIENLEPVGRLTVPPIERMGYISMSGCLSEANCPDVVDVRLGKDKFVVFIGREVLNHGINGKRQLVLPPPETSAVVRAFNDDPLVGFLK